MDVFHLAGRDIEPLDSANFTGSGTLVRMTSVSASPAVNAYRVSFEAGTRTAWHTHSGTQLLLVTEGTCRCQKAGEPVREVAAGGIVAIAASERHWHGATPEAPMTHVALNIEASTTWFEKVSDEEYGGS
ncbi:MAG TPA: cupin domain-containing protein [Longimicrobiales bacterium]|nr:cupin domain-containing protein [Longimicrobiales bacterium]